MLHQPLAAQLKETIQEHVERSRASHAGGELCPPEVIEILTTAIAAFVVSHTERGVPHEDMTLTVTKLLASKMMKAYSLMEKLHGLFGKEES